MAMRIYKKSHNEIISYTIKKYLFEPVLNRYTTFHKLRRVKTTNFGTLFELIYSVDVLENIDQKKFVDELRALNGNMTINLVFFKYDDKIYES